jgi:regulatory protein
MRSEDEVRRHLLKKEVEEPIINEVIHKLYQYQFLNDLEFAKSYVRTQRNTTDKGTVLIAQQLKEKGISQRNIEEALHEYNREKELETAIRLAEKHQQKNKTESTFALRQKLEGLLIRKGFPFVIIQEALGGLDFSKEDEAELEIMRAQGEKFRRKYQKYSGYEFSQKMKQALYRKGFAIELIERYLAELEEADQTEE